MEDSPDSRLRWKAGWNTKTTIFKSLKVWRKSATNRRKSWMTLGRKPRIRMLPDLREQQKTENAISKTWNILNCGWDDTRFFCNGSSSNVWKWIPGAQHPSKKIVSMGTPH
jgi:hypothetical protein